jgi:DNA-binding transcriptional regulator GbsR (MarR family)
MKNSDPPNGKKPTIKLNHELSAFIESFGRYFENYGIPRIGGRILGLLLVAHAPLSAEAISKLLKVSRASISTNFRLLIAGGLAETITYAGDRTTYYTFPENAWEKTMNVEISGITTMKRLIEQGLNALPPGDSAAERMKQMIKWTNFILEIWNKAAEQWKLEQAGVSTRYPSVG